MKNKNLLTYLFIFVLVLGLFIGFGVRDFASASGLMVLAFFLGLARLASDFGATSND